MPWYVLLTRSTRDRGSCDDHILHRGKGGGSVCIAFGHQLQNPGCLSGARGFVVVQESCTTLAMVYNVDLAQLPQRPADQEGTDHSINVMRSAA